MGFLNHQQLFGNFLQALIWKSMIRESNWIWEFWIWKDLEICRDEFAGLILEHIEHNDSKFTQIGCGLDLQNNRNLIVVFFGSKKYLLKYQREVARTLDRLIRLHFPMLFASGDVEASFNLIDQEMGA